MVDFSLWDYVLCHQPSNRDLSLAVPSGRDNNTSVNVFTSTNTNPPYPRRPDPHPTRLIPTPKIKIARNETKFRRSHIFPLPLSSAHENSRHWNRNRNKCLNHNNAFTNRKGSIPFPPGPHSEQVSLSKAGETCLKVKTVVLHFPNAEPANLHHLVNASSV